MQVCQPLITRFLRISLRIILLVSVTDQLGWIGQPGDKNSSWGNWPTFVGYAQQLNPFVSIEGASLLAILATSSEAGLGFLLMIDLFTR